MPRPLRSVFFEVFRKSSHSFSPFPVPMASNISHSIDCWARDLPSSLKTDIRNHHAGTLMNLRLVHLDKAFLLAALRYWDIETHAFRFRNNEITPLPEEIGAILDWPKDLPPCLPDLSEFYYRFFERFLGLERRHVADMIHGHNVDLVKLIHHFRSMGYISPAHRRRAFIYCLFCQHLYIHEDGNCGLAPIIGIVEQFEVGRSPAMLCAGELLLCLDEAKTNPTCLFRRCPIILQV